MRTCFRAIAVGLARLLIPVVLLVAVGGPGAFAQGNEGLSPHAQRPLTSEKHTNFGIPQPLQVEHEELHSALAQLTRAGGQTGESARKLAEILDPHFQKENEYALPPLGLLLP